MNQRFDTRLFLKSPRGDSFEIDATKTSATLNSAASAEFFGQWICYSNTSTLRLIDGLDSKGRVDCINGGLVFRISSDDVGEEFVLLVHTFGYTLVRFEISPIKCSIENYHSYVKQLRYFGDEFQVGAGSSAAIEDKNGRFPTENELAFTAANRLCALAALIPFIRSETPFHRRASGGQTGVDALKTLVAWREHSDWYALDSGEIDRRSIQVGKYRIKPLKAEPRIARTSNEFLGAVRLVLKQLAPELASFPGGALALRIAASIEKQIEQMDNVASLNSRELDDILKDPSLPRRSKDLANQLMRIRNELRRPTMVAPAEMGEVPFSTIGAELVFQRYCAAIVLTSQGFSQADVISALGSRESIRCKKNKIIASVDSTLHGVGGWRDRTALPSSYKPDIVFRRGDEVMVIDAKFRSPEAGLVCLNASAVKEVQSYMQEFSLARATILFPTQSEKMLCEDLKRSKFWIRGIGLPATFSDELLKEVYSALEPMWNSGASGRSAK